MTLIFRNLLHVIRRFKLATVLNILGLSVAFASFMIIMMQLSFSFGFDRFHKNSDKIFRVEYSIDGTYYAKAPTVIDYFVASSPHIVAGAVIIGTPNELVVGSASTFFQVENNEVRNYFTENTMWATQGFTDVFTFDFVEGNAEMLKTPESVMIPLSIARRFFGNESALGRHIFDVSNNRQVQIQAVYRDFPANSSIGNFIYFMTSEDESLQVFGYAFIRLNDASNAPVVIENFMRTFDWEEFTRDDDFDWFANYSLRLTALTDIHFTTDVVWDNTPKSSRQTLMILLAIAIVIVVIASINFTNFSTALSPMRVKNINTQRVLGAQQRTIRFSLAFEAVAFSLVSYGIALLLVKLFADSQLANLVDADVSLSAHPLIVGSTALVALLAGLLAGFYPMRYMTSFAPALALKGNFALSPKGKRLRNTLIGVQYIASFVLIIGTLFMFLQNHFMKNSDLGFDRDGLIVVNIGRISENRDAFTEKVKSYSGIEAVTYSWFLFSNPDDTQFPFADFHNGEMIEINIFPVNYNFLQVMGIEIAEGRDFRPEDVGARGAFILNETARRRHNMELGTTFVESEIIGFIDDIHIASFRMAVEPLGFWLLRRQGDYAYIRVKSGANLHSAMTHIRNTLVEIEPNYPFEVRFFDDILQSLYESERNLSRLILLFSLIAIFISIVGVFGLVVFDSEVRRKEIGIRKVHGASTAGIILMFNKTYFTILVVCFVIATPVAWFAIGRWLENFAFRTPLYWWGFALAFLAVSAITVLTVTIQNWRVANDNPVKSIKTE